jgi:hypothetical protein
VAKLYYSISNAITKNQRRVCPSMELTITLRIIRNEIQLYKLAYTYFAMSGSCPVLEVKYNTLTHIKTPITAQNASICLALVYGNSVVAFLDFLEMFR